MPLKLVPAQRHCVARRVRRVSPAILLRDLLTGEGVQHGFVHTATPMPAYDDTAFGVIADDRHVLLAVSPANSMGPRASDDSIEIFIDPRHDHLGYFQLIFTRESPRPVVLHHLPYGEAASTAFPMLHVLEHTWATREGRNVINQRESRATLLVRFAVDALFPNGRMCGLNVCRYRPAFKEATSWNLSAGNGLVDAMSLGHLWLHAPPAVATITAAELVGDRLHVQGTLDGGPGGDLALELAGPTDERARVAVRPRRGEFETVIAMPAGPRLGRHRLYLAAGESSIEPGMFMFDVAQRDTASRRDRRGAGRTFDVGLFYDLPDDLRATHFTPDRLAGQLDLLRDWGVRRVNWIDYGPTSAHRSFWEWASSGPNARRTMAECGDLLPRVATLSRERGMRCYGVFKPFDMGFSEPEFDKPARDRVLEIENRWSCVMDEVAANQHAVMATNPAWAQAGAPPVSTLRISSECPIPKLRPGEVELLVSEDNRRFVPYRGKVAPRQGVADVPNVECTPAGLREQPGTRREHFIEWRGLSLRGKFAAVRFRREGVRIEQRMFLVARAWDAKGDALAAMPSTGGSLETGLRFSKDWPGWANATPKWISGYVCEGRPLGVVFDMMPRLPQTLEPMHPDSKKVWLGYVQRIVDAGCDGVDIRTICMHHCTPDWLRYAFAPCVREAFEARYGRPVEATQDDYERVRRMRGEAYTQFLREAREITRRAGRKLVAHIESGVEVPANLHTRMELHLDWERWIDEGIVDELMLKFWGSQSLWVHERVLPRAKKRGIRVHICDMNFTLSTLTGVERAGRLAAEAKAAGFDGFSFYETYSYLQMNPLGLPVVVGHADHALRRAAEAVMNC